MDCTATGDQEAEVQRMADQNKRNESENSGISNRESATEEARERESFPSRQEGSPSPQDAAGRTGEDPLSDTRDRHTSHKAGSRSIAQKESGSRYPDRSMPASRKVAGAFGREPVPESDPSKDE
jgi:hypothetical protein